MNEASINQSIPKLLVVEAERDFQESCSAVFQTDFSLTQVFTFYDAKNITETTVFDIIILNLRLPDGEGIDLLRILRKRNQTVPVLIITEAHDLDVEVEAFQNGATDFFNKPINFQFLLKRIHVILKLISSDNKPYTFPAKPNEIKNVYKKRSLPKMLVVDDEDGSLLTLRIIFKDEFEIITAQSAAEALELFQKDPVDIVISDICMAGMNGIQLLQKIRQQDLNLPVILITAFETAGTLLAAVRLQATDYIAKPFSIPTIRKSVVLALRKNRARQNTNIELQAGFKDPSDVIKDDILYDTTAAFIHKLINQYVQIKTTAEKLNYIFSQLGKKNDDPLFEPLEHLSTGLDSTFYILQRFRNTIGRHPGVLRLTNIRELLLEVKKHLSSDYIGRLSMHLPSESCNIMGDHELLWHLFENLIRNGLEAVQTKGNGHVHVELDVNVSEDRVKVLVQDNGVGIDQLGLTRLDGHRGGGGHGYDLVGLLFKVHRGFETEGAVAPHPVVVFFNVVEKIVGRFGAGGVAATCGGQAHAFAFVGGIEAFHRGVVVGISRAAHARGQAGGRELGAILATGILHAAIAVMQQPVGGAAMLQGHLQGPRGEAGVQGFAGGPAHDAAAPQIQQDRHIQPAFRRPHIGQIGDPRLVHCGGGRLHGQPVRRDGLVVVALRGPWHEPAGAQAAQSVRTHQSRDAFAPVPVALGRQFRLDARRAVAAPMLLMHGADLHAQRGVGAFAFAGFGFDPSVIAVALHGKGRAEGGQGMVGFHAFNGFVALGGGSVKIPTVFFNMSRCSRTRASSARSVRFSAARSPCSGIAEPA